MLVLVELSLWFYIQELTFTQAIVYSTNNKAHFTGRKSNDFLFIDQNPDSEELKKFRQEIQHIIDGIDDEMTKATLVRKWVREQQGEFHKKKWAGDRLKSENPLESLLDLRAGNPGACRRFAYILVGALVSAGLDARLVHVASDFKDKTFNHTLAEVWLNKLNKWVLIDADYDTYFLVDGKLASMIEIYEVVSNKQFERISFERNGSNYKPIPIVYENGNTDNPSILLNSFKHLYFATTNAFFDGYRVKMFGKKRIKFLNYYDNETQPYPEKQKRIALFFFILYPILNIAILIFFNNAKKLRLYKK